MVGEAFTVAVAAGVQAPVEDVEAVCEGLAAQQHFLDDTGLTGVAGRHQRGTLPVSACPVPAGAVRAAGTGAAGAAPPAHWRAARGGLWRPGGEIAAQLAVHFERGGEVERAVRYSQQAADNAARRNAHHEAIAALTKGLALLATLPESPERAQHELTLLLILGPRLMAAKGYAVPEVGEATPGPTRWVSRWGSHCNAARRSRASIGFILSRHSCAWLTS